MRERARRPRCEIVLQNPNRYPEAAARTVRPWLAQVVEAMGPPERGRGRDGAHPGAPAGLTLGVRFAGDREVRRVNRTYRGRDEPTDVLSFPGDALEGCDPLAASIALAGDGGHLGDILVSVPTARRQAAARGWSTRLELEVLLLHGLLHCLGYDHETDRGEMERLERRLRRRWVRGERERAGGDGGA